jgi:hypothetical protein
VFVPGARRPRQDRPLPGRVGGTTGGGATAVRTETSLNWMVDDHHGTASMTVDATTQAVTRRYTKPFGETRGATPSASGDAHQGGQRRLCG